MRCHCCDNDNTKFDKKTGRYYCRKCWTSSIDNLMDLNWGFRLKDLYRIVLGEER
jgi:transcription initiation factor TFIIIB Brf1 subunit/transcription initiation factor TFIIB